MDHCPLYTIGYGSRSVEELIALLKRFDIAYLIDVRSQPHSRWRPKFNRETLAAHLEAAAVRYVFMGDCLGGRPDDPACYRDQRVDYRLVQQQPWFINGIERLIRGCQQGHRMAMMCAEQRPEVCHRTNLVADALNQRGVVVAHIDENGEAQSHEAIIQRITGGQGALFEH